jgi:hypothetical protein
MVVIDPIFDFFSEVSDKSLDGPCGSVSQCANGMAFDLARDFLQRILII